MTTSAPLPRSSPSEEARERPNGPRGAARGRAAGGAREIAEKSPLAVWGSKEMLNYARDHSIEDGLNYIATWQAGMFFGGDMAEAFVAKKDGRKAQFQNLPRQRRKI